MQTMIHAERTNAHLSGRERGGLECAEAFSRRTPAEPPEVAVALSAREVALIEALVGEDRSPVSSALLLVAGIGAAAARRAGGARRGRGRYPSGPGV